MKYIYQKRTLHSFPDYLKLKATQVPYSYRLRVSLSPSTRSARSFNLQVLGLPNLLYVPGFLERTFLARTGMLGLEFYIKT